MIVDVWTESGAVGCLEGVTGRCLSPAPYSIHFRTISPTVMISHKLFPRRLIDKSFELRDCSVQSSQSASGHSAEEAIMLES